MIRFEQLLAEAGAPQGQVTVGQRDKRVPSATLRISPRPSSGRGRTLAITAANSSSVSWQPPPSVEAARAGPV